MRSSVSRARRCREKRVRRTFEIKTIDSVRMSVRLRLENAEPRGLGHFLLPRSSTPQCSYRACRTCASWLWRSRSYSPTRRAHMPAVLARKAAMRRRNFSASWEERNFACLSPPPPTSTSSPLALTPRPRLPARPSSCSFMDSAFPTRSSNRTRRTPCATTRAGVRYHGNRRFRSSTVRFILW